MSFQMERVLELMATKRASDAYLLCGSRIHIKINGQSRPLGEDNLTESHVEMLLNEILPQERIAEFKATRELNTSVQREAGVFRISAYVQRNKPAVVVRYIPSIVPNLDDLGMPPCLKEIATKKRGLVLMVGATGTGKSTTLAAMVEHRNATMGGHILTIEDPMEFIFEPRRSIISQREVGTDTEALAVALKNAMRQSPDCILIGEIRDRETMASAISYSLSGHLVLATMHCNNSYHTLNRILSMFPLEGRAALCDDLASSLEAVISQRLLRATRGGRVPAVEVLINSSHIASLIRDGKFSEVREAMERSMATGSHTFERRIAELIRTGVVTEDEGMAHADSSQNLRWFMSNDYKAPVQAPPVEEDSAFHSFDLIVTAA